MAGTASCSGRGCHGGLEPRPGAAVSQNEFTIWQRHGPHSDAYKVLLEPRSQAIVARLAGGAKPTPAHLDARCLACHTTPSTAALASSDPLTVERLFGVGCESCHGNAVRWLDAHTQPGWASKSIADKAALGMVSLSDPLAKARACAGCHVGSGPDTAAGITKAP